MAEDRFPGWVTTASECVWHVPCRGTAVLVAVCGRRLTGPVRATRADYPPTYQRRGVCPECVGQSTSDPAGVESTRRRRTFRFAFSLLAEQTPAMAEGAEYGVWEPTRYIPLDAHTAHPVPSPRTPPTAYPPRNPAGGPAGWGADRPR